MPRRPTQGLTEVELEFMRLLWAEGELTPPDLVDLLEQAGRPRADGSVRKILEILRRKGYVTRRRQGRGFVYRARRPEARARAQMAGSLLSRLFDGSASLMLASLFEGRRVSPRDLERIKEMIAEYEESGGAKGAGGSGGGEAEERTKGGSRRKKSE